MTGIGRREFLAGAGTLALTSRSLLAGGQAAAPGRRASSRLGARGLPLRRAGDLPQLRGAPPGRAASPRGRCSSVIDFRLHGPGEGRADFGAKDQQALKEQFASLIGATADEIAYTSSTSDGENIVVMGLDLAKKKGNVVIDELHFTTSLYMYKELEKQGVELRIVKHRNWAIDPARHGQGDRSQHAARLAGAGVERQRLHARLQGGERPRARARRAGVRRHHPGGRRGAAGREGARHRLRVGRHLQVDHGRARVRVPLREEGRCRARRCRPRATATGR